MAEYISRDWLLTHTHTGMDTIQMMQTMIDAPAADVVEVRHAKFMPTKNFSGLKCSACGSRVKNSAWRTHKWCYACGAKMDGGVNDGKAD